VHTLPKERVVVGYEYANGVCIMVSHFSVHGCLL
jgi:hypothetical protein